MLLARHLQSWEVLQINVQGMGGESSAGNRHVLVVMDRASKFALAYPLRTEDAESVERALMDLVLMFGVPWSIRSDSETGFTAKGVEHLFRRQKESIDYGPANHARAQRSVESPGGGGGWIHEALAELYKSWHKH